MAEKHTATAWTGGGALIAAGGIFMAVTGFEPTKKPGTVWANSWFDLGFAFVLLGMVITGIGIVLHFRKEAGPGSTPPAVNSADFEPHHAPLPPVAHEREMTPLKMTMVDEDWSLVEDTLWAFAIAIKVENTTDKTILVADSTFTNLDDGDRNVPLYERFHDIWLVVKQETKHLFDAHLNDGYAGIFEPELLFSPNQPEVLWYIGETLPPQGGGRPRFTFTLKDSLGNSYDMDIDRRPAQRFRT